jgi:hypothetical protein
MIPIPSDMPAGSVPKLIDQALRRLIRRIRKIVILRGVSAVVATSLGALLAIMAIDAGVVLFSDVVRWLLTLSALALTVASAVWFLILPLARTITLTGIARSVEERHPELQERLSSAVELLSSRDMPELRGSEALIAALAQEASRDAEHMRPRAEISLKAARPFLLAAGGAVVVLGLLLGLYPNAQRLLVRAVAPYANMPNVTGDMLRVTPGDARILEGQRLEVEVSVANTAVRKAQFRKLLPDGSEAAEAMTALPAGEGGEPRFTLTCPPGAESFRYRIHAGDALSKYFAVTVVPPPVVKRLEVRYEYPAYTMREARTEPDSAGEIKAVIGTVVTVSAVTNKPVKAAQLQIGGQPAKGSPVQIAADADGATVCKFQVKLTPRLKSRWILNLTDEFGFSNSTGERLIEAVPDLPPVVKLISPDNKRLRLKPTDHLPLTYTMTDDFGLGAADISVETDTRKHNAVPLPLEGEKGKLLRAAAGDTSLDLAKLPLQGARQFTLWVRAADNLPASAKGPQEGRSEVMTVELDLSAASYAMQALEAEAESIRKALEKILKELKESKKDSVPLKDNPAKLQALAEETTKSMERMRGHLGIAKDTAAEVTARIAEGTFAGLAPKAAEMTAEVDGAHDKAGQIKLVETLAERSALATQTDTHIDRAIKIVEEMLKQLHEMADAARLAQSLQDLAERQQDLAAAKAEAEMAARQEQAAKSPEWQKSEAQVARETGNLVKDNAAARLAQMQQDQARAKDLAAEARKLQQEQQALAQDTSRLGQLAQIDQALKDLAAAQAALSRDAAQDKAATDQAKPMAAAAENIKSGALAQAVEKQKAAENSLKNRAETGIQPPPAQENAGQQPQGQQQDQQAQGQPQGQQAQGQPQGQQAQGQPQGQQQQSGQQPQGQPQGQQPQSQQQAGQQPQGAQPAGQQMSPEEKARAGQLAARQQDLRQQTESLLAQRNQAAAEIAKSQMGRLKEEQAEVAKEAAQLAQAVAPIGEQPAQLSQEAAGDAKEAAEAIPSNIGDAAQHAAEAGQELGALAQDLNKQVAEQAAAHGAPEKAAGQQESGNQQAGAQEAGAKESGAQESGAKEAGAQEAGAKEAGAKESGAQEAGAKESGAQEAGGQKAGGQEAGGKEPGGQESGGKPADGQPSSGSPDQGQTAELAQQASALAERQQELAREMQALAADQPKQALQAEQQAIQAQTADLQQEAAALGQQAQAMAPEASGQAQQANQALGQAQQAESQASQAMAGQSPQSAVGSQQTAASELGNAAAALGQLGQALAKAASQSPAAPSPMGTPMANAFSAASQAAQSPSTAAAAEASQAMSAAASQAMGMAQGMGVQPGMGKGLQQGQKPSQSADSKKGIGAVGINSTAAKLESLGIKLSDWARLPGELRSQILQAADEAGPEEYRTLIKRYFQQVAKRGGAESEGATP